MNKVRVEWLDGIRGVTCFNIMLAHILVTFPNIGVNGSGTGKMGVCMFYILSGYLCAIPYYNNHKVHFSISSLINYYIKKILRIFPCFILAVIIAFLLRLIDVKMVIKCILLKEEYGHFWYIPVILGFYLVSPIAGLIISKIRSNKIKLLIFSTLGLILALIFPYTQCKENSIQFWYYLPVFIMGISLYIIDQMIFGNMNQKSILFDFICIMILLSFVMAIPGVRNFIFGIAPDGYLQNKYIFMGIAWAIFLHSFARSKILLHYFDKCNLFKKIGEISYPLYLIHYLVIVKLCQLTNNNLLRLIGTIVMSLILAWLMNKYVEKPFTKLRGSNNL